MFLKPDALEGDATQVSGAAAADFAVYLASGIDGLSVPEYMPLVAASQAGAERARTHASNEMRAIWWYTGRVQDVRGCQERLRALHSKWKETAFLAVGEVVADTCAGLGFDVALSVDRILTADDYMAFYCDTDQPGMHERMMDFMVGRPVRLLLVCGQQENSALQLMKTYLRYVMRYPIEKRQIQNWIHVTNPDASNYHELLRMYAPRC